MEKCDESIIRKATRKVYLYVEYVSLKQGKYNKYKVYYIIIDMV